MTVHIPFTNEENTLSRHNREISVAMTPMTAGKIYSIFLWDIERGEVYQNSEWDTASGNSSVEHYFTVPPKVVEFDEPFTPHIVPTQNGGKFTENHGSVIKNLKISGTTGLRPFKKPLLENKLDPSEITGHDTAISLRNLFRLYSDKIQQGSNNVCMIYRNIKDDDYWVVEPTTFKIKQDSGAPFSYSYDISFQTVTRFTFDLVIDLGDPIEYTSTKSVANIQKSYASFVDTFFRTILSNDIINGGFSAIRSIQNPLRKVIVNLNTLAGAPNIVNSFISEVGELATLLRDVALGVEDIGEDFTKEGARQLLRSYRRSLAACYRLLTDPLINRTNNVGRDTNRWQRVLPIPFPNSCSEGRVLGGESIRDIASRTTGDPNRWQELCVLNDLKPPYVSSDGRDGTLAPGDTFLFPTNDGIPVESLNSNTSSNVDIDVSDGDLSSKSATFYGRDLRLRTTQVGGIEASDITITPGGDISQIVGVPNVEQGIKIKFSTRKKELPAHPAFGAKFPIGSKATISSFNDFRLNVEATLRSDYRIEDILKLDLVTVGDVLTVSAKTRLVNAQSPLNIGFAIQRL